MADPEDVARITEAKDTLLLAIIEAAANADGASAEHLAHAYWYLTTGERL